MDLKLPVIVLFLQTAFINAKCDHDAAIRSIQSEDGDIIDCIDIYKQSAFDHPSLKDHKIQLKPSYEFKTEHAEGGKTTYAGKDKRPFVTVTKQTWHKSGKTCPKGTIPVRRMQKNCNASKGHHLLGDFYGKKTPMAPLDSHNESNMFLYKNHSVSILHTEGSAYIGGKGDIRVWNPNVEFDDEYSLSRVTLRTGPSDDFEAVESGWVVNPSVYGDRQTRLYVYWTADGSVKTGCFDLTCPGFVQTSNQIALGAAIYPLSHPTLPYQITVFIHRDPNTSNWWVQYGERYNIGYWPGDLFLGLSRHAETVQWGGEVSSTRVGTAPHTTTGMGSGQFSDFMWGTSGYVKRMRVLQYDLVLRFPRWAYTYADEYNCYDYYFMSDYLPDPELYYGGPGRNPICP